jgi:DNA-binding IclR family transcriptional regulator
MLLKTLNVKSDLPTVEQARSRLRAEISLAREQGYAVLKIIHGWGSHGVGGDLRVALQATLAAMVTAREIAAFIPGEQWRISDETTWNLLKLHAALKKDFDLGKENKGISIILL